MADKKPKEGNAPFATRIDPTKEGLSQDQLHYIRQVELEQWKKKTQKLRTRNVATGLAIGALVLGICILGMYANINARELKCLIDAYPTNGYTFYSVSQERIMDEMDEEAKRARTQGPKTGAN
ncbi:Cytochrome c oxidase assembly factor 3 -like protein, mitochondrial [Takifugu flavidus]|uniref:Cytochrome c oxidase assembly factor 3 n=1 Tax=Takifugu flavidus TaxID=433684 RepID=A0A5C6PUD4_9TELE|nr:Cytochrome c oxidase assembly factor 3 -like protein, mitochondrial [Takifugu flavidus]